MKGKRKQPLEDAQYVMIILLYLKMERPVKLLSVMKTTSSSKMVAVRHAKDSP